MSKKKKLANDPSAMRDYAQATQQALNKGGNSVSNMSIMVKVIKWIWGKILFPRPVITNVST